MKLNIVEAVGLRPAKPSIIIMSRGALRSWQS